MNCKHCGEKLTFEEEQEVRQAQGMAEQLCAECFTMLENLPPPDETWDSDSGL